MAGVSRDAPVCGFARMPAPANLFALWGNAKMAIVPGVRRVRRRTGVDPRAAGICSNGAQEKEIVEEENSSSQNRSAQHCSAENEASDASFPKCERYIARIFTRMAAQRGSRPRIACIHRPP